MKIFIFPYQLSYAPRLQATKDVIGTSLGHAFSLLSKMRNLSARIKIESLTTTTQNKSKKVNFADRVSVKEFDVFARRRETKSTIVNIFRRLFCPRFVKFKTPKTKIRTPEERIFKDTEHGYTALKKTEITTEWLRKTDEEILSKERPGSDAVS